MEISVPPSGVFIPPEVIRYFLCLGITGFGGSVALCGPMERDLAERRRRLDKSAMGDAIAVRQTMPGRLAVRVAIFVGYSRRGFWGAWVDGGRYCKIALFGGFHLVY